MKFDPYSRKPVMFYRTDPTARSHPLEVDRGQPWARPLLIGVVMCFILVGMLAGAM